MSDCLFCRVVAGELPSEQVASSRLAYAFRDIAPAMPSHVLVASRQHIGSAADLTSAHSDVLAEMFVLAREVARSEGLSDRGYRLVFNVGEDAQNSVAHLHLHVLGGRQMGWPPG
ncbi:MAG: histidine triad nucleotide-binding protein [Acidimicrobiales bacterium]